MPITIFSWPNSMTHTIKLPYSVSARSANNPSLSSSLDAPPTTAAPPANKKPTASDVSRLYPNTLADPLSISSKTTYLHARKRGDVPSPRTPLPFNPQAFHRSVFSTLPSLLLLVHFGREHLVHLRARIDIRIDFLKFPLELKVLNQFCEVRCHFTFFQR